MEYFAHSDPSGRPWNEPGAKWQRLNEHLRNVASLAEGFAGEAGASEALIRRARALGLLHDLGKYTSNFQRLLRGEVSKAPHSAFGAAAAERCRAPDVAFAIAGHHGGMPDPAPLKERLAKARPEITALLNIAIRDCAEIADCFQAGFLGHIEGDGLQIDCSTRVLFSCLIDADRIDSARHGGEDIASSPMPFNAAERLRRVLAYAAEKATGVEEGPVKTARAAVLDACLLAAGRPGPLFSLTVPTGGAKTLASMAFALRRAELFPPTVRRVIVVIPFLSIIEQNAKVYRDALGPDAVLEHHSGIWTEEHDELRYVNPRFRLATENWNAPVVVTTSVRFFEALFSNKPKDLRRMHNVARSVVILDEVQTLPRGRVAPILSMMRGLAEQWGTTFVFCTATQPAFERHGDAKRDPRWHPGTLDEIIAEPGRLFAALRRVELQWPTPGERKAWDTLAGEVAQERQALVVVNTRGQALELFRKLSRAGGHVLHLSNNMCPVHRLKKIDEIHSLLNRKEPCIAVSTQLVEAGVDLDFPAVWRALGPLDSIAQAAGRCDREGKLTKALGRPGGKVVVFRPEDEAMPAGDYKEATRITDALAAERGISIDDPDDIRTYFNRYYDVEALDSDEVEELRRGLKFAEVANRFAMIEENNRAVIVPYDNAASTMLRTLGFGALSVLRRLQQYTVNLWEKDFRRGVALGAIYQVIEGKDIWAARAGFYDEQVGLRVEPDAEGMVV